MGRERGSGTRERGAGRARENERSAGKGGFLGGKGGAKNKNGGIECIAGGRKIEAGCRRVVRRDGGRRVECVGVRPQDVGGRAEDWTYPSSVRQILTSRSAPQPAIMKTPNGGTGRPLALL